jgi:RimJ/RimL family protein N-acetyltransferase
MCGIIRRETLPELDLGYALLPEWWGQGLAREAARACVAYAQTTLGVQGLLAIITPSNAPSIRLVEDLGFLSQGEVTWTPGDPLRRFRLPLA